MSEALDLNKTYRLSDEVVLTEIDGEIVIAPLNGGIGEVEDELLALDETGQEVWKRIDGSRPVAALIREMAGISGQPGGAAEEDVLSLLQELLARRMIVEKG